MISTKAGNIDGLFLDLEKPEAIFVAVIEVPENVAFDDHIVVSDVAKMPISWPEEGVPRYSEDTKIELRPKIDLMMGNPGIGLFSSPDPTVDNLLYWKKIREPLFPGRVVTFEAKANDPVFEVRDL